MVDRAALIKWGTIAFIGFFFLEFFVPLMYVSSTATPTPLPETSGSFTGSAVVIASVKQLGSRAFVSCPGFNVVANGSGLVKEVVSLGQDGYSVELAENVSSPGFAGFLALNCQSAEFLRSAFVQLNESASFSSPAGEKRVVTPAQAAYYARSLGLALGLPAFVSSNASAGSTVNLSASLSMQDNRVLDLRLIEAEPRGAFASQGG